jgi:hypothetical protein
MVRNNALPRRRWCPSRTSLSAPTNCTWSAAALTGLIVRIGFERSVSSKHRHTILIPALRATIEAR